nr:MAG TPA: Scaffold protein [Microviridae sp.]
MQKMRKARGKVEVIAQKNSGLQSEYGYIVDNETGEPVFCKVRDIDIRAEIASHADECDMSIIVGRLLEDPSDGYIDNDEMYGDVSELPKDILEAAMYVDRAKVVFNKLPLDVRKDYDSNLYRFLKEVANGEFAKKYASNGENGTKSDVKVSGQGGSDVGNDVGHEQK